MNRRQRSIIAGVALSAVVTISCAINPVTGKKQLVLISEAQEIQMGREADKDVVASIGLYPDQKAQQYVQALGSRLAAATERPNLPWTFRVVDDPAVNAFAIPGGFVYVTRGIMTHLNSEAELVAVLGHEIGHVTARHSVSQISQQQLAQVGLAVGTVLSPKFAQFGNLAGAGLGMLFLKFSRTDESQADQLGLKYMLADGYDPRKMVDVFRMLEGVGQQAGAGRLPQWLATHPDPENREAWATKAVASLNRDLSGLAVNRPAYLRTLDGMTFGENPREGFFEGTVFRHPEMAFRIEFPAGWTGSNQKQAVGAISPEQDAAVVVQLSSAPNARQAAQQFLSKEGMEAGEPIGQRIGGFPALSSTFRAKTADGYLVGMVAWIDYRERVFEIVGYAPEPRWPQRNRAIAAAIGSFARETDPAVLNAQPRRLTIVSLNHPATIDALLREYPSTVSPQIVALINGLQGASTLAPGEGFKRVIGGPNR